MSLDPALREQILASVPSLRAFAISLSGNVDRADDLVQETLLRALANIHSFQPGTNMPAWLFTILHNTARNRARDRARDPVHEPVDPEIDHRRGLAHGHDGVVYVMAAAPKAPFLAREENENHRAAKFHPSMP